MKPSSLFTAGLGRLGRKAVGVLALSTFVLGGGALSAFADSGPAFNGLAQDYSTLQVGNVSNGTITNWGSSVNANPGDRVALLVWDHNSVPNTTAHNVRVKILLPTAMATSSQASATLSADNAASVTGTATVTTPTQAKLAYVPGSAVFYRSQVDPSTGQSHLVQVAFPAGVNPDDVVNGGINLGDQDGCWQYAQAVAIQATVQGGNPAVLTTKEVQIAGTHGWNSTTPLATTPGTILSFRVHLQNVGTATANAARIDDTLDPHLTYLAGSSNIIVKQNGSDVQIPITDDHIGRHGQTLTWAFGPMAPQADASLDLYFQATVADGSAFPVGNTTLQNCALSTFDSLPSVQSNCVSMVVTRAPNPVVSFNLRKEVIDRTIGATQWQVNGTANPGDQVSYRITISNAGNTAAANVNVKDLLPAGVTYLGNAKLYNTANPNGLAVSGNDLVNGGYVFSSIEPGNGNGQYLVFDAQVANSCSGSQSYDNVAHVSYTPAANIGYQPVADAHAVLNVVCSAGLNITKQVQDPADGLYKKVATGRVHEGQVLSYKITVVNTGNTQLFHVNLRDALPQDVTYQPNSLAIDGQFQVDQNEQSGLFNLNDGVLLTNLTPGMTKVITFNVVVSQCPDLGDTTLTNTAFVRADGVTDRSDSASATLRVVRPSF